MVLKTLTRAACVYLAMVSLNAGAALIDITATSTDTRVTDFTLRFDDISGDGLLQLDEVMEFSGFTLTNPANPASDGVYDVIIGTPDIDSISTASGIRLFAYSNWNFKRFEGDTALCCSSNSWTYSSAESSLGSDTVAVAAVPVPAAFWLFGSGLIGLLRQGFNKTGCKQKKDLMTARKQ
ncbi:MAG: hypothetical protein LJE83_12235 [Gammaproteobacteria bacterium]|nr:hypothetical protein [Gammaproteobacteria bacterium]